MSKRGLFVGAAMMLASLRPAVGKEIRRAAHPLPERYIVVLHDTTPRGEVREVAEALVRHSGGKVIGTLTHSIKAFGVRMPDAAAKTLADHPLVKSVEEDELFEADALAASFSSGGALAPSKFRVDSLTSCPDSGQSYDVCTYTSDLYWHLDRIDNLGPIYSNKQYGYKSAGTGVRAYVVDSGVYAGHTEFEGRVEAGANMMVDPDILDDNQDEKEEDQLTELDWWPANNPCGSWRDDANASVGHGTAVASVIAGKSTGVAKNATIIPVKVWNCEGVASKLAVARGLDWILADMEVVPPVAPSSTSAFR